MGDSKIKEYYTYLYNKHGPQNWWPCKGEKYGNDEILIGAILTQNTSWMNVEKALNKLREKDALNLESINNMDIEHLKNLIRSAGFYNQKAKTLKAISYHIIEHYGNLKVFLESKPTMELRKELLEIKGIGKETADSILLYAGFKFIFVVDKYTYRLFKLNNIIPLNSFDYEYIRIKVENQLKSIHDLQEFHALIVKEGKTMLKRGKAINHKSITE